MTLRLAGTRCRITAFYKIECAVFNPYHHRVIRSSQDGPGIAHSDPLHSLGPSRNSRLSRTPARRVLHRHRNHTQRSTPPLPAPLARIFDAGFNHIELPAQQVSIPGNSFNCEDVVSYSSQTDAAKPIATCWQASPL